MIDAVDEIDRSMDPTFVFHRGKRFVRDATAGAEHSTLDHGVFGLTQCVTSQDPNVKKFRMVTMPKSMLEQRWARDDFSHDPVINMAARHTESFTWTTASSVASKRGLRVAEVCREHTGQHLGLAFPMIGMGRRRGCASVGLDMSPNEFSPTQVMMIRHVVERAYFRVDTLLGPFAPDEIGEPLSVRELDVLRRIADGMTAAQAAKDMGVSRETAIDYLARAKRKTGTKRTAHTVKVALSTGLMLP